MLDAVEMDNLTHDIHQRAAQHTHTMHQSKAIMDQLNAVMASLQRLETMQGGPAEARTYPHAFSTVHAAAPPQGAVAVQHPSAGGAQSGPRAHTTVVTGVPMSGVMTFTTATDAVVGPPTATTTIASEDSPAAGSATMRVGPATGTSQHSASAVSTQSQPSASMGTNQQPPPPSRAAPSRSSLGNAAVTAADEQPGYAVADDETAALPGVVGDSLQSDPVNDTSQSASTESTGGATS